jgi:hypothetical protein
VVEQFPKLEGRQMIMMIAPGKKKAAAKAADGAAGCQAAAARCATGKGIQPFHRGAGLLVQKAQRAPKWLHWTAMAPHKWLGANKSAKVSQRLTSTTKKEHSHAQNEDQEQREKALPRSSRWDRQARSSLQASHPDQEDHQEQAPPARAVSVHETNMVSHGRHAARHWHLIN